MEVSIWLNGKGGLEMSLGVDSGKEEMEKEVLGEEKREK